MLEIVVAIKVQTFTYLAIFQKITSSRKLQTNRLRTQNVLFFVVVMAFVEVRGIKALQVSFENSSF